MRPSPTLSAALTEIDTLVARLLDVGWDATRFTMPAELTQSLCALLDALGDFERLRQQSPTGEHGTTLPACARGGAA